MQCREHHSHPGTCGGDPQYYRRGSCKNTYTVGISIQKKQSKVFGDALNKANRSNAFATGWKAIRARKTLDFDILPVKIGRKENLQIRF